MYWETNVKKQNGDRVRTFFLKKLRWSGKRRDIVMAKAKTPAQSRPIY